MHPSAETMVELMVEFAAWLTRRRERTNRNACVRVCVPRSLAQSTRGQRAAAGGEQVFQQQTTKSLTDIDCMEAVMALPRNNSPSISTHSVRGGE